jgi:hypothetical protein
VEKGKSKVHMCVRVCGGFEELGKIEIVKGKIREP